MILILSLSYKATQETKDTDQIYFGKWRFKTVKSWKWSHHFSVNIPQMIYSQHSSYSMTVSERGSLCLCCLLPSKILSTLWWCLWHSSTLWWLWSYATTVTPASVTRSGFVLWSYMAVCNMNLVRFFKIHTVVSCLICSHCMNSIQNPRRTVNPVRQLFKMFYYIVQSSAFYTYIWKHKIEITMFTLHDIKGIDDYSTTTQYKCFMS